MNLCGDLFRFVRHPSFIAAFLLAVLSGSPASQNVKTPDTRCPADMAWVEAGGFCMDRYEFPNKKGEEPIRDIDLGEAIRLCASRGKTVPSRAEFTAACGGQNRDLYVYGPNYLPGQCRSGLEWPKGPAAAGSYPGCARDGIYDLNGNVWEWVWQEKGQGRSHIAGGAWNTGPDHANCQDMVRLVNLVLAPSIGVRCILTPVK